MTTLLLLRHGENDYLKNNKMPGQLPGIALNSRGNEQAIELARTLGHIKFDALYSSPLQRALETAAPLARLNQLDVRILPELTDINVGRWTGRDWRSVRALRSWEKIQKDPSHFRFPAGESFLEVQFRVVHAMANLIQAHPGDEVLAVFFHADPIKLALTSFLGLPLDAFQRLAIHTGSISIIKVDQTNTRIIGINLIPPVNFRIYEVWVD